MSSVAAAADAPEEFAALADYAVDDFIRVFCPPPHWKQKAAFAIIVGRNEERPISIIPIYLPNVFVHL